MRKSLFIILIILGFILPILAYAALVPCGTKASGRECTLCDLFVMLQLIMNYIWWFLLIIAPLFIIAGGVMILTAGIKPDQLEAGKRIITGTIIGLAIAFLSWAILNMVFNTLAKSPGEEGFPWPWNEIQCTGGGQNQGNTWTTPVGSNICTCGENSFVGSTEFSNESACLSGCSNYCQSHYTGSGTMGCCNAQISQIGCFVSPPAGTWCERPAPSGSNIWILAGINSDQKGDANLSLTNFINCMYQEVIRVYGNTNNLTITSISDDALCAGTCTPSTGAGCAHTRNSCHYGGTNCSGASSAVDFRATATTCAWLAQTARYCGGSNAWINWETNHLHISLNNGTCGCNESVTPIACPSP